MKHNDLPERWKVEIIKYLRSTGELEREVLYATDFVSNQTIEIKFEDGSFAIFKYAFVITASELREVGIFTEHCGYHIFNLGGICIKNIDNE